jgi:RNase P/RNase MRP subunit p29
VGKYAQEAKVQNPKTVGNKGRVSKETKSSKSKSRKKKKENQNLQSRMNSNHTKAP